MTKYRVSKKNQPNNGFLEHPKQKRIRLGDSGLRILLLALIIVVGFSYLYYINGTATGGFDIKGIENQIEETSKQNKHLEIRSAEMQSLAVIEEASQGLEMVPTSYIEYLPAVGSVIAVR